MNYIIIYATVLLLKLNNKPYRIFLGSIIGAVYAVLSVVEVLGVYNNIFVKILVSVIIIYISTDTKNFKSLFKALLVFYLVSFTFGGIALALLYFIKPENILMRNGVYTGTYPIKIVLLGGVLGIILFSIFYQIIKNKYSKKKKVCEIEVAIDFKSRCIKALIDSGNFLKEPITGVPVVVVETAYLFELIPKKILENIDNIIEGKLEFLEEMGKNYTNETNGENIKLSEKGKKETVANVTNDANIKLLEKEEVKVYNKFINRFRIIPFNSLGKENGLLLGIKADYIKIIEDKEYEHKKIENIIIGLYNKKLSKERSIQCNSWFGFIGKK